MKKYIVFIIFIIFITIIVSTAHAVASAFLRSGGLRVIGDIYCHTNSGCIAHATKECLPVLDNADESGNPEWFDCLEKAERAAPLVTSPFPSVRTTPVAGTTNTNPSPTLTPTPTPRPTATPTPTPGSLDTDGDGILNGSDRCPTQAEDLDGDRDSDGCPESPLATSTPTLRPTPRPTSAPTLRPTPTPRASITPRPSTTRPPGPPRPTPTPTPRPTTQTCTPQVTAVTIGNTQGNSASINLQQYGCSATAGSTCSVTALVNLTCGTPNPHPITLSFTYTRQPPAPTQPLTCSQQPDPNYCANKYANQYYDCGQPNQVIGQATADGEGCYNENLVNPPPVQPQTCQTKGGSNYCASKYGNQYYDCGQPNQVIGQTQADSEGCYNENLVNPPPPTCTSNDDYYQFVQCIGCGQALWVCPEDRSKPPISDADYPWETRCRTTQWCGGGGGGGGGGGSQCRPGCQYYPGQGCWYPPVPAYGYGFCQGGYEFDPQDEQCWQRC